MSKDIKPYVSDEAMLLHQTGKISDGQYVLIGHIEKFELCWASNDYFAECIHKAAGTVGNMLHSLCKKGLLSIVRKGCERIIRFTPPADLVKGTKLEEKSRSVAPVVPVKKITCQEYTPKDYDKCVILHGEQATKQAIYDFQAKEKLGQTHAPCLTRKVLFSFAESAAASLAKQQEIAAAAVAAQQAMEPEEEPEEAENEEPEPPKSQEQNKELPEAFQRGKEQYPQKTSFGTFPSVGENRVLLLARYGRNIVEDVERQIRKKYNSYKHKDSPTCEVKAYHTERWIVDEIGKGHIPVPRVPKRKPLPKKETLPENDRCNASLFAKLKHQLKEIIAPSPPPPPEEASSTNKEEEMAVKAALLQREREEREKKLAACML